MASRHADSNISIGALPEDTRIIADLRRLTGIQNTADIVRRAIRELLAAETRRLSPREIDALAPPAPATVVR